MNTKYKKSLFDCVATFQFFVLLITVFLSGTLIPYSLYIFIISINVVLLIFCSRFCFKVDASILLWGVFIIYIWIWAKRFSSHVLYFNVPATCIFLTILFSRSRLKSKVAIIHLCNFSLFSLLFILVEALSGEKILNVLSFLLSDSSYALERQHVIEKTSYQGLTISNSIITYSCLICAAYGFYLYTGKSKSKKYKILRCFLVLMPIIVTLFLQQQRSNLLFAPLSFAFVFLISDNKNRSNKFIYIICSSLAIILVVLCVMPLLYRISSTARLLDTLNMFLNGESVLSNRSVLYERAIEMWKEKPLLGYGWFEYLQTNFGIIKQNTYSHTHNIVLEILADGGLVGLFVMLSPIICCIIFNIKDLVESSKYENQYFCRVFRFTLVIQVFFIIDSLLHVTFYLSYFMILYFVVLLVYYSVREEKRRYETTNCL